MDIEGLVSIVIPTYNRAYCIQASIESVLAQTYGRWELIIVDDGSTDDTKSLVSSSYGLDDRIRYVHQQNAGVSAARNAGLRIARGEFIALLDSDDRWEPWKLELQIAALRRLPEVGMIWTEMKAVDKEGALITANYLRAMYSAYDYFPTPESLFGKSLPIGEIARPPDETAPGKRLYYGDICSKMVMGNLVHTSTVLLRRTRREEVGLFREDFRAGEDYEYHLRTCRAGPVAFMDVSSITYQVGRSDQITIRGKKELAVNFLKTVEPILRHERERLPVPPEKITAMLAESYAWAGDLHMEDGDRWNALKALGTSLRYRVKQPRTLALFLMCLLPFGIGGRLRRGYRTAKGVAA